jgi:hypothetical protein
MSTKEKAMHPMHSSLPSPAHISVRRNFIKHFSRTISSPRRRQIVQLFQSSCPSLRQRIKQTTFTKKKQKVGGPHPADPNPPRQLPLLRFLVVWTSAANFDPLQQLTMDRVRIPSSGSWLYGPLANYDPLATTDNGSCTSPSSGSWCTDPLAAILIRCNN